MSWFQSQVFRRFLILPPLLIGVVVLVIMSRQPSDLERKLPEEQARDLRVIRVPAVNVVPRVIGYGTAGPAQVWRAAIEVGGRVIELHPKLDAGDFLQEGEVALRIDEREYELAVRQLEAELTEVTARLAELATQVRNDRDSLQIEQDSLALAKADFERIRNLAESADAAPTELRIAEREYLAQKQLAQNLQNAIRLNEKKSDTVRATQVVTEARLAQTRLDLEKTTLRAPFHCRLQEVNLELNQYLQPGQQLFEADGIGVSEIDVQVPLGAARNLVAAAELPEGRLPDMKTFQDAVQISAVVRLRGTGITAEWAGRFVRVREQIDPVTRTVQFVVAVDEPYHKIQPGVRPPLVRGAYCEVELRARAMSEHVVVPRASVFEGVVYVVDDDDRLRRREIATLFEQSDFVCLAGGLEAGTRLVVSDPRPAIDGQLVEAHEAEDVRRWLIEQAAGVSAVR
ncbi:MAG: efflux RND transporter periplasmic adaptor subunit [Planctomycetota bacterium]